MIVKCIFPFEFLTSAFVPFIPSAIQSGQVSGCSDEFRSLMSVPTPGALQLKKHLTQPGTEQTEIIINTFKKIQLLLNV